MGRLPANLRDGLGETIGGGSGLAVDPTTWKRDGDTYRGTFYMLPDRGYNIFATTDYHPRFYKISLSFKPSADPQTLAPDERQATVAPALSETVILREMDGRPLTGLDPEENGVRPPRNGFPPLPQARTGAVSLDPEAIVRLADGTFFISDEYGPYIYRFSADGRMLGALRPPEALIPKRQGKDHFSSDNPAAGVDHPNPADPENWAAKQSGFRRARCDPGRPLSRRRPTKRNPAGRRRRSCHSPLHADPVL